MSNTIDGMGKNRPLQPLERAPAKPDNASAKPGGSNAGSSDTVSLTSTAENLRNLEQSLADVPEVNQEKVDAIRSALAKGDYSINAEVVAKKFVEIEKALGKL